MNILGRSVLVRYRQLLGEDIEFPENHYRGDYIRDLAAELKGTPLGKPDFQVCRKTRRFPWSRNMRPTGYWPTSRMTLARFGVKYDNYFKEKTLHESNAVSTALDELRRSGKAEMKEGALWFVMEDHADEKDRVLVRATGEPTYFAADVAYHEDKLRRGYGMLIDIWGSDHHGYVPRVKAGMEAFGHSPDVLRVLLVQFVTLVREGQKISMSTRAGEFVTLREVLDEVGADAARFFFLTKRCDSHLDFDLDLAKKQSRDNPVYYVQYCHMHGWPAYFA